MYINNDFLAYFKEEFRLKLVAMASSVNPKWSKLIYFFAVWQPSSKWLD